MKAKKVREFGIEEAKQKVQELRMELLKERFAAATTQQKNPVKKKLIRKDIARFLTIIKEKTNARPSK